MPQRDPSVSHQHILPNKVFHFSNNNKSACCVLNPFLSSHRQGDRNYQTFRLLYLGRSISKVLITNGNTLIFPSFLKTAYFCNINSVGKLDVNNVLLNISLNISEKLSHIDIYIYIYICNIIISIYVIYINIVSLYITILYYINHIYITQLF